MKEQEQDDQSSRAKIPPAISLIEFSNLVIPILKSEGKVVRKSQFILAKKATGGEKIATLVDNEIETTNTANPGDFIITNQSSLQERYIVNPENFHNRYDFIENLANGFAKYAPKGSLIAIQLNQRILHQLGLPATFYFIAPWGEPQIAKQGDYLLSNRDFNDIYRISLSMYLESYVEM